MPAVLKPISLEEEFANCSFYRTEKNIYLRFPLVSPSGFDTEPGFVASLWQHGLVISWGEPDGKPGIGLDGEKLKQLAEEQPRSLIAGFYEVVKKRIASQAVSVEQMPQLAAAEL